MESVMKKVSFDDSTKKRKIEQQNNSVPKKVKNLKAMDTSDDEWVLTLHGFLYFILFYEYVVASCIIAMLF